MSQGAENPAYPGSIPEDDALAILSNSAKWIGNLAWESHPACIVFTLNTGETLTYWRDGEYGDAWVLERAS